MSGCSKYEACDIPTCNLLPRPHCIYCDGQPSDHPDGPKPATAPEAALVVAGKLSETARAALKDAWQKVYSGFDGPHDFWIIEEPWPIQADPAEWWMAL